MKRFIPIILLLPVLLATAQEDKNPLPGEGLPNERADAQQQALDHLFTTMGGEGFASALEQAEQSGIHPQVLLEARFLHLIDMGDHAGLAAMAPELIKARDHFDPDNSEVFSIKEDWLAIIHYTQALAALENGDKEGFKKNITEAFWLSPRQGQAFAPHIDKLRLQDAMKSISLDLGKTLQSQGEQQTHQLGDLITGHRGAILHFWSPMSQQAQINMPDFVLTTQSCKKHNIAVLSILVGQYPDIVNDAQSIRIEDAQGAECVWLIDAKKQSLADLLRIRDVPTMVIASPDGKIVFNGHPSEKDFWQAIQKIAPDFERPNSKATGQLPE